MNRRSLLAGVLAGVAAPVFAQTPPAAPHQGVTFQSEGKSIRAILYQPQGRPRGSGVVMMHGSGGGIRSQGPWHDLAMRFAADGYAVLTPAYFDAYADDGVRPQPMMEAWRKVARDGVAWLAAGQGIAPGRVGLFGYSLGSYVAVDGALGDCEAGAAIGLAGGVDVYPPRVPRRRIPVLMIRAERDTHVLPRNTAAWVSYLRERDVNVRVQVVDGAGHLFTPPEWADVFTRASGFFADNVGRIQG